MKTKIISMLIVLGMLSVMPLIYTGKFDPMSFFQRLEVNTDDLSDNLTSGLNTIKKKVPGIGAKQQVTVYRWRDARGSVQFGSYPPANALNVETVSVDTDKNVVDAVKVPVRQAESDTGSTPLTAPSPYSVKGMKKVLDDARGVEELLKKSHQDRQKMIKNL